MASYFFSCRSHCHSLSHSLPCSLLLLLFNSNSNSILSILPQPPASREASAALALSLSLGVLSRTRALLCMLSLIFVCLRLQPVTAFGTLPQPSALCSAVHALSHWRSFHLPASSRQAHSHTAFGLPSLSLCRCLRCVRHRLRGHRCWRRRHRQSFTNFQCERALHLFTVYSARFVRCCCCVCVCVCRIKCVVLEVCACVYVYLPHLLTTPPPPVPPRQIRPRRSRRLL